MKLAPLADPRSTRAQAIIHALKPNKTYQKLDMLTEDRLDEHKSGYRSTRIVAELRSRGVSCPIYIYIYTYIYIYIYILHTYVCIYIYIC